ncbi:ATP-, maltotriose-and DNA-dependent transcriptional regulator MalT [Thermosyntropha lipolytica DSM 11003]|uniref:ATP-, maltotriose-and DNA-dependent transcriptional regulator MalT n=1 Tax=Thermosyntropha lipolytica DSM 11003 TaxID=1123382 RepID=A0A1M5QGM0_9FIRM|nr:BTAD domain-containing putative transcriptional regulator [Thermosyntropha lipolytica]SHH13354.1 ATP-, maltotriose-and DNA-dependent transcriptional regulator MalT [Thermosyntropha lipolytica DSM 11003]
MDPIISTKLICPEPHNIFIRERLFAFLEESGAKLIVINAGAGFGKTSLVSSFLAWRRIPFLWYQLDQEDSDIHLFMKYLEAGLEKISGNHPRLKTGSPGELKDYVALIINSLSSLSDGLYIVLEDYHQVEHAPLINSLLEKMVIYLPPQVKIILTTRNIPPLPLASFRAKGWLKEIEGEKLKFTLEETRGFFKDLNLSEEDILKIWKSTEGWAAGLKLARYAMEIERKYGLSHPEKTFISYADEYIREEVINKMSPEMVRFFEQTSILDTVEVNLAAELTGYGETEKLLDEAVVKNLFVTRLDENEYRYLQMFKDYLERRLLSVSGEDELKKLHQTAGHLYWERKQKIKALNHLLQAEDYRSLSLVMQDIIPQMIKQGEYEKAKSWLDKLPDNILKSSPYLTLYRAMAEVFGGFGYNLPEEYLHIALKGFEDNQDYYGIAQTLMTKANYNLQRGYGHNALEDGFKSLEYLEKMADNLDTDSKSELLGEIYSIISQSYLLLEKWNESTLWLQKSIEVFKNNLSRNRISFMAREYQFFIYHPRQNLRQALSAFRFASKMWENAGNSHESLMAKINMAIIYRILGEYDVARDLVAACLAKAEQSGDNRAIAFALFTQGQIQRDTGQIDKAIEAFHDAIFLGGTLGLNQLEAAAHHCLSSLYRKAGNITAALEHGHEALRLAEVMGINYFIGQANMNLAMIYWAAGKLAEAREIFSKAREIFIAWNAQYELARTDFYIAAVMLDLGEDNQVINSFLEEGLKVVKANDYRFFFYREKENLVKILKYCAGKGIEKEYIDNILKEWGEDKSYLYKFYALGAFKVFINDKPIPDNIWKNNKVFGLLRYLLINKGKKIERDIILDTFWPEMDMKTASANLSSCLYTLRKALEPELKKAAHSNLIKYNKGHLWLEPGENVYCDVWEFVEEGEKLIQNWEGNDDTNRIKKLEAILSLYKGDLFEEYPYDDWVIPFRERIRELWCQGQEILADWAVKHNQIEKGIKIYKELILKEPCRERYYEELLQLLIESGQKKEALQYYQKYEKTLREEFGVSPEEKIQRLIKEIL